MTTRAQRLLTLAAATGALTMLLAACAPGQQSPGSAPTSTADDGAASIAEDIVGTWGTDAEAEPFLEFTEGGDVRGSDGCNGIHTTYTVEDDVVELAPYASTLMACMDVDDWLRGVRTVSIDGDTLTVMNDQGETIGELGRTA
ncbi:META domain-containing protein [uncultured Microbacterium sp.]|uniref:META domain-containing protein n=1 Tax=uncultured Microbacterium sp. TaxID=191216 RepID=UPI002609CA63|nr:META domain-containing protein [uncultured Microbacterium sp.]